MPTEKPMRKNAFTLIEVLLVVVIIAVLASIVIVALNPQRQINQAQDAQRRSDVTAILNAVYQYAIDTGGTFPSAIDNTNRTIADFDADICTELVPTYLVAIPFDPDGGGLPYYTDCSDYLTDYQITLDATSNRITVTAPNAELETISVTR